MGNRRASAPRQGGPLRRPAYLTGPADEVPTWRFDSGSCPFRPHAPGLDSIPAGGPAGASSTTYIARTYVNTARKGNAKENRTGDLLQADGYLIGSRRHLAGPGDWLAWRAGEAALLIEVKATQIPYQNFKPAARAELLELATRLGAVPLLAWWAPRARAHKLIPAPDWPRS